jgi:site-specific DNA-methyltransferase (adenine-specific)
MSSLEKDAKFPLMDFRNIMNDIGFNVHKLAIWDDRTMSKHTAWGSWMSASAPNIMTPYEGILIAYKKSWKKLHKGESTMTKEQFIEGVSGLWRLGTTRSITKANFPEKLPDMCINLLSYKGDTVLDPFMGSGTTGVSAVKNDRNFMGFELSPNYCKIANDRIYEAKIEYQSRLW